MKPLAFIFAVTASLLPGQGVGTANRFSGPVLGFVPGAAASQILPIRGIAGAARLGDPVLLPDTVTQIYLAPGHSYALAAQGPADPAAVVMLLGHDGMEANPALRAIPGALAHPDLVAFSPGGGSAALYSEQGSRVQVFTGLPNAPRVSEDVSSIPLTDGARALAISDDARAVLIADGSGAVYEPTQEGAQGPVYRAAKVSALAFLAKSEDAIVCDPAFGLIALLRASASVRQFQPPSSNGCQPQAAASTADGRTILMACPAQHSIWSIDRESGSTNVYKVANSPTALERVGAGDVFLTSPADDGGTYWLMTWHADGPMMSFIGAANPGTQGSGN